TAGSNKRWRLRAPCRTSFYLSSFLHSPHWITPEHAFRLAPWAATTTTFLTLGQAALVLFWPTLRGKEFPAHCSWPTFRPASAACTPWRTRTFHSFCAM